MSIELFQHDFMIRAFIVGIATAAAAAVLGNFIVAARQAVVSDMLAHTALVGVGVGIFWNVSPSMLGFLAGLVAAVLLWWLTRKKQHAPEAISMLLLTGGLATALMFTHLNKNSPVSLDTYLFGSILTISTVEVYFFIAISMGVLATLFIFWKPLMTLVFDADFLRTQKRKMFFEILFMMLIALTVGLGLKVIGGLLIAALLIIPVLTAQLYSHSFSENVRYSVIIGVLGMTLGITSSFYIDIPASSGIVLSLVLMYVCTRCALFMRSHFR